MKIMQLDLLLAPLFKAPCALWFPQSYSQIVYSGNCYEYYNITCCHSTCTLAPCILEIHMLIETQYGGSDLFAKIVDYHREVDKFCAVYCLLFFMRLRVCQLHNLLCSFDYHWLKTDMQS